jgi:hypothetical protein
MKIYRRHLWETPHTAKADFAFPPVNATLPGTQSAADQVVIKNLDPFMKRATFIKREIARFVVQKGFLLL